jgi:DNA modification methylase/DNA-binding XRE family transcriptional regulator
VLPCPKTELREISPIGKNIKKLRKQRGLSQDRLSKWADLSLNTVVNIGAGNNPNPTIETLEKIAKALEVSIDDLLKNKIMANKITKLNSDVQEKVIKKNQEHFVLTDEEQKTTYSLNEILNKVIIGDCLKVMKKLSPESVDCVFVDPPYFLQLPPKKLLRWTGSVVNGVNDQWDVFKDFNDYDNFTKNYLTEIKRLMKPTATIWVIGTYHNIHRIGKMMLDLGFWILNDVVWFKTNPMPNFLGVRFTNATETLLWAIKDKKVKNYTFNKEVARSYNYGKLGINVWRIPLCTGTERLKDEKGQKIHSTQKPEELLKRVIMTSTKEKDIVFDPMAGVGTTGYVAKQLNRKFIMIEINKNYVEATNKRFESKFSPILI